MEENNVVA